MGGLISLQFRSSPKQERPYSLEDPAGMDSARRTPPCGRRRSRPVSGAESSSSSSLSDDSSTSSESSDTSSITSLNDLTDSDGSIASSQSSSTSPALSTVSSLSTSTSSVSEEELSMRPPPQKRPRCRWLIGRRRKNPACSVSNHRDAASDDSETGSSETNARTARQLESRLREMENALKCAICLSRRRDVAFLCGHAACSTCAAEISSCHICRRTIKRRIRLY
ncbi:uncharacterized protein LOC144118596 [Amblyomma americanum]